MDRGTSTGEFQAKVAEPGGMGLGLVIATLRRSPRLIAGLVVVAVTIGASVWVFLPLPKMTGYALFHIHSLQPHILSPGDKQDFNLFRQSQAAMVRNRVVLNAALRDPAVQKVTFLKGTDKLSALESMLKVDFKAGPEFMRITIEGDNPEELQAVVSAVAQSYLDDVVHKKKNQNKERRDKLVELEGRLQGDIKRTTNQLSGRLEAPPGSEDLKYFRRAERAELQRRKLEKESEFRETLAEIEQMKSPNRPRAVLPAAIDQSARDHLSADREYNTAREQRERLNAQIKDLRRSLAEGKTTPQLDMYLGELKTAIETCAKKEEQAKKDAEAYLTKLAEQNDGVALGRLQSRAQLLRQIIAIISKDLDEMGVTDVGTPGEVFEVERWRAKLGKDRELLTRTQSELWTLQLEADAPDRVTKIDADVMSGIEGTRRLKFSAMAAVGILAAGLGVLVWRESRNPRVLNSRQLPGELGLPLIGVLPALRQSHKATLAPATDPNWQVVLGDAVNAARTILQYGVSGPRPARSILVGSALSGEGKTSASLLLARSLAQAGHRTLLIDGDLRHPRIHQALDLPSRVGLCEYLAGAATPTEILQPTGIPELTAIAAGMWSAAGNQGLTTGRWTELVTQAAEQYEYVIIDSAPILPVADTLIMARSVDGVLLSVMRDVSELTPVKETLAQLALIGTRVLGVVMNGGQPAGYYRPRYSPESTPAPPLAS